jgi:L-ascorbate metabolism protein UlaG (beta-lactamase superfamily)
MRLTRRKLFGGLAALVPIGASAGFLDRMSTGIYSGPVSDHFDGTRFNGPYAVDGKGVFEFWRWRLTRTPAKWPERVENGLADKPPARVEQGVRIGFVGHASFLLQTGGLNILIDPVWAERASPFRFAGGAVRVRPPGIAFDNLPRIDAVLITHGHYDHLDVETLGRLIQRDAPRIFAPLGNDATIMQSSPEAVVAALDWHDRATLNGKVAVTLVPARHWTARGLFDRNRALWGGYVIETPEGRICHVTDTGYHERLFREMRDRYGPFKLALIPIGSYEPRWFMSEQHVNPEEAVRILQDCGAERAIGYHFGTFPLADEAFDEPVARLRTACAAENIEDGKFLAPEPGQVIEL